MSDNELKNLNLLRNKVSPNATFYHPETIKIGDNSRIDDFCVLSENQTENVHIATHNILAGGMWLQNR